MGLWARHYCLARLRIELAGNFDRKTAAQRNPSPRSACSSSPLQPWGLFCCEIALTEPDRHLGSTKNSGDPSKAYPASIASLFASLRQFWASHTGDVPAGERLSADSFKENPPKQFRLAVDYVSRNFKKLRRLDENKNTNYSAAAQRFQKIERGGNGVELGFEDLIIAAEWVGLTVAQLMIFCNLVSTERRAENSGQPPKEALRRKISEYQRIIDELSRIVDSGEEKHILYGIIQSSEHKYYARETILLNLVRARKASTSTASDSEAIIERKQSE